MDASDPEMKFFDFEKGFSDVNSRMDKMETLMSDLAKKLEEMPYPYPGAKKKKKKDDMADGEDDEEDDKEFAKLVAENADLKKKIEDREMGDLMDQFSKLNEGNAEAIEQAKDFSKEQLEAAIKLSGSQSSFSKTQKGQEDGSQSDFSKNLADLEMKFSDFSACGLSRQAAEVKSEIDAMKARMR